MVASNLTQWYPTELEAKAILTGLGFEYVDMYVDPCYVPELDVFVSVVQSVGWTLPLTVYGVTSSTIGVRPGYYVYNGEVKLLAAPTAIDPTDNDTTYVWLTADNAIDSGIDGDGWPSEDHMPLAEVDVDSDGEITAIRDLRGKTLCRVETAVGGVNLMLCWEGDVLAYENNVLTY